MDQKPVAQWWNKGAPDYRADHSFLWHPKENRLLIGDPNTHHTDLWDALDPSGPKAFDELLVGRDGWVPGAVYDEKMESYDQHDHPGWRGVHDFFNELHTRKTGRPLTHTRFDSDNWTFGKIADQGTGGDSYPGSTPEAQVERQHVNDSYGQDSQFDDHPLVEYKFFFADGVLDVSGVHDLDGLRERNNVAPEHDGPTAVGNLIVQDGTAIWEVTSNVSLGALVKALKKYTKDGGWDWGGVTDMKGEPLGDPEKLARKRYWITLEGGQVQLWTKEPDRPADSDTGRLDVVGRVAAYRPFANDRFLIGTAEMNALIMEVLGEYADDHNLRLAEYPGGAAMTDQLKNHSPLGEDLELKNIDAENPDTRELERFHKDKDRTPEGIFRCPTCGILIHRWREYLLHRREEESPGDPVEDGHFPTVEESLSQPLDPIEAATDCSTPPEIASKFLHGARRLAIKAPKDMFTEPVPFIYDIELDRIFVGHPGARHGEIEAPAQTTLVTSDDPNFSALPQDNNEGQVIDIGGNKYVWHNS